MNHDGIISFARRFRVLSLRALAIVIGCSTASSTLAQGIPVVQVQQVREASLAQTLTLSGDLRAPQITALSARVEGYIKRVDVQAGDRVSARQSVIQLDDEIPRLELSRLQAVLKEAESLMSDQQRRADEAADLIQNNNFSKSEYESLRAEVSARRFRLEQFRTQTAIQQAKLARHEVRIPYDGVVVEKLVEVGQQINPNTPLLWLASMNPLWAEVRLPERYFGRVQAGTPVRIQTTAGDSDWVSSRVTRVVPVSVDGSRTFLIRTELANSEWSYAPGMSIRMELSLNGQKDSLGLQVPADAISRRVGGATLVWVARSAGDKFIVQPVTVTLGASTGTVVEVTGGDLKVGDKVVTRGNEVLRPGQEVHILAAVAPSVPGAGS